MEEVLILIPAAGASSRMRGADKLMQDVGGEPALRRAARIARATGARVLVTLPEGGPHATARRAGLQGLDVQAITVAKMARPGMTASCGDDHTSSWALVSMLPQLAVGG